MFTNKRSCMMLRVLINRYHPNAGGALLKFLPEHLADAVNSQGIVFSDLKPILEQPHRSLAKIHYSWLQPILEKLPPSLKITAISALTEEQRTGFSYSHTPSISNFAKTFILSDFYQKLKIGDHLPVDYLPETELSVLFSWTKSEIVDLIDFLGLYDLASEVRKIVNRNHLKNIYSCLSSKQLRFLKACLHQKEQLVSPTLGIDPTKQDCARLKQIIHRRGLFRLAKALCGQHADLVWHIAHVLDSGRGNILLEQYQTKESTKVTNLLRQQTVSLMNYLKSE